MHPWIWTQSSSVGKPWPDQEATCKCQQYQQNDVKWSLDFCFSANGGIHLDIWGEQGLNLEVFSLVDALTLWRYQDLHSYLNCQKVRPWSSTALASPRKPFPDGLTKQRFFINASSNLCSAKVWLATAHGLPRLFAELVIEGSSIAHKCSIEQAVAHQPRFFRYLKIFLQTQSKQALAVSKL